jgi:hypothetical protein
MRKSMFAAAPATVLAGMALFAPGVGATGSCPPGSTNPAYCPAPIVTTGPATNVSATSARLTGSINGQGAVVTYHFEYGTNTSYGSSTPNQTLPASTATQAVSARITGLQKITTYHYRLVAVNQANKSGTGLDASFTTRPVPRKVRVKLTIKARPKRDTTAPFKYLVSGKLILPTGVSPAQGCTGNVTIRFDGRIRHRVTTVLSTSASVKSDCTYSKSVTLDSSKLAARGNLRVTGHFEGNSALRAASRHTHVLYG